MSSELYANQTMNNVVRENRFNSSYFVCLCKRDRKNYQCHPCHGDFSWEIGTFAVTLVTNVFRTNKANENVRNKRRFERKYILNVIRYLNFSRGIKIHDQLYFKTLYTRNVLLYPKKDVFLFHFFFFIVSILSFEKRIIHFYYWKKNFKFLRQFHRAR